MIRQIPKGVKLPKYPKSYLPFGFESTWRLKNLVLQNAIDEKPHYPYPDTKLLTGNRKFMLEYKKLTQWKHIDHDPHNIEIQTIKVKNKPLLIKEYQKLSTLMNRSGFIESSRSFNNHWEGGGHIHIDYAGMFGDIGYENDFGISAYLNSVIGDTAKYAGFEKNFSYNYTKYNNQKDFINNLFADFTHNIFVFLTNNPWIPWAFNAPNDNDTAKNPIVNEFNMFDEIDQIRDNGLQLTEKFTIDSKEWAVVLRPDLGTFEFRFFGMPKSYKELSLHIDVAQAIIKHCFDLTMAGTKLKPIYSIFGLQRITYRKALNGLKKICTTLNIPYDKVVEYDKVTNLRVRYAYQAGCEEAVLGWFEERECMLN